MKSVDGPIEVHSQLTSLEEKISDVLKVESAADARLDDPMRTGAEIKALLLARIDAGNLVNVVRALVDGLVEIKTTKDHQNEEAAPPP